MEELSIENLRQKRTCEQFCQWVKSINERCKTDRELRNNFWLSDEKFFKVFREEAMPLWAFIDQYPEIKMSDQVLLHADDSKGDATIFTPNGDINIEVTRAREEGQTEKARMYLLSKNGMVGGHSRIRVRGNKDKEWDAYEEDGIALHVECTVDGVIANTAAKLKKKLSKPYPKGTWLLISIDDSIGYREPVFDDKIANMMAGHDYGPFEKIIIQSGPNGKIYYPIFD